MEDIYEYKFQNSYVRRLRPGGCGRLYQEDHPGKSGPAGEADPAKSGPFPGKRRTPPGGCRPAQLFGQL